MNVLVTGGCGYFGNSVIAAICESESVEQITIYDNLSRGNFGIFSSLETMKPVHFVQGDLLDNKLLEKTLVQTDAVIHLAAIVTQPFSNLDAHRFDQVNHWGTALLVDAINRSQVGHLIHISSATVYGETTTAVNESYTPSPITYYAKSKLAGESCLQSVNSNCKVQCLRVANTFGINPATRMDTVMNSFLFDAKYKNRLTIFGTGEQQRPFVQIHQVGNVVAQCLQGKVPEGVFDVVDFNLSVNSISKILRKEFFPNLEIQHVDRNMSKWGLALETPGKIEKHLTRKICEPADAMKQVLQQLIL